MNSWLAIALLIASIFTGGLIVNLLSNSKNQLFIKLLLAFSGGLLLSISFVHFIPEIYIEHGEKIGIYVLVGFLIQLVLEYFSKGIEHGHVHSHGNKIPIMLLISLSVHAIIEGIPLAGQLTDSLFAASDAVHEHNHSHDHSHSHSHAHQTNGLLYGILFHKIPVAIALMTLMVQTGYSKLRSWLLLGLFAIMSPIGILIGMYGIQLDSSYIDIILAIVVGMFLHVSTTIIFETSEGHKFNFVKLASILLGATVAFLIH